MIIAALLLGFRKKGGHHWEATKRLASKADLFYSSDHVNSPLNPNDHAQRAPAIERKTIFGGVASIFAVISFVLLAIFLVLDWRGSILVTSSVLPFGHLAQITNTSGRLTVTVDAYGYGANCSCGNPITVSAAGISSANAPIVSCFDVSSSCRGKECDFLWRLVCYLIIFF